MSKKEIITFTGEERQRYLMDSAGEAVLRYGAQFECKMDKISLLIAKKNIEEDKLKEKFGVDVIDILNFLKVAIANMVAYKNGLENKTILKEDVSSIRFLKYKESLAKCYKHLFLLDRINKFLVEGTEAEKWTVPSHYWSYALAKEVTMPDEFESPEEQGSMEVSEEEESG